MKRKLKRRLLKLIERQLLRKALPERYMDTKVQHAFEGMRSELASHNKRLEVLELRYGIVRGNVSPLKSKKRIDLDIA